VASKDLRGGSAVDRVKNLCRSGFAFLMIVLSLRPETRIEVKKLRPFGPE
jgi:hypothetical protein